MIQISPSTINMRRLSALKVILDGLHNQRENTSIQNFQHYVYFSLHWTLMQSAFVSLLQFYI